MLGNVGYILSIMWLLKATEPHTGSKAHPLMCVERGWGQLGILVDFSFTPDTGKFLLCLC